MNWVIVNAVIIHVIFIVSVFDIYFKTPIIHGVEPQKSFGQAPAKRVVLIVADGLRAESLYGPKMRTNAPFLLSASKKGTWGISHTQMPTESRPGHVAILAGFYEDPSALFKGWKENPVEFDSVLNQSTFAHCWGSPDILNIFTKGANRSNIYTSTYSAYDQDFSGKRSTLLLDEWVFTRAVRSFVDAKQNPALRERLEADGVIIFLHLLGLDVAGHTHKPHSELLVKNLRYVDSAIREVERIVRNFYKDDKTTFIFTSDHGMTDWGSHGSGHPNETETPFIAWGSGIMQDDSRKDLKQADIAPLVSVLIGKPIPVNSIGILPFNILNMPRFDISHAIYANVRQIVKQFEAKDMQLNENSFGLYSPYPSLNSEGIKDGFKKIELSIKTKDYFTTVNRSYKLINNALEGLKYFHTYYSTFILRCISASYIFWIYYLYLTVNTSVDLPSPTPSRYEGRGMFTGIEVHLFFFLLGVLLTIYVYMHSLALIYYVYAYLPVILCDCVCNKYSQWRKILHDIYHSRNKRDMVFYCFFILFGLEILIKSFFDRRILSVCLGIVAIWPMILKNLHFVPVTVKLKWCIACLSVSVFLFYDIMIGEWNLYNCLWQGILWIITTSILTYNMSVHSTTSSDNDLRNVFTTIINNMLIAIAILNTYIIDTSMKNKSGLPFETQAVSWCILIWSSVMPLFGSYSLRLRLINIIHSFIPVLILLSNTFEVFYVYVLAFAMHQWFVLEHEVISYKISEVFIVTTGESNIQNRISVELNDYRRAFLFLLFSLLAFFGTSSIASLNSFDPNWTRCFIATFSPFTMTFLIVIKMLIPFLTVICTFRTINVYLSCPVKKLFLIVLMYCEIMGVQFLHLVKNEGSWLDIGTSLSHYIIMQCVVLILVILYGYSIVLTRISLFNQMFHYKLH